MFGLTAFGCAPGVLLVLSSLPRLWLVRAQMARPCVD
jgi:hypothetical protein